MRSGRFVCHSFRLSVCLSVVLCVSLQDYCKSNQPISRKLGVVISISSYIRCLFWAK